MTFDYATRQQLLARLRQQYATATGDRALKIGAFFATCSQAELRAAFNMSAGEVAALQARLETHRMALASVRAARGE